MSFGAIAQQGPKEKDPFMQNSIFEKIFEFFFVFSLDGQKFNYCQGQNTILLKS